MNEKQAIIEEIEGKSYKELGFSSNPFVLFPKDIEKNFIGRKHQLKQFYRYTGNLLNNQSEGITILGRHGIGKSHFLKLVFKKIKQLSTEINLEKVHYIKGISDFKEKLLFKKTRIISELKEEGNNFSEVIETYPEILAEIKANKQKKFLIFIDDLDLIYNTYPGQVVQLFETLNNNIIGIWNTSSWNASKKSKAYKLPSCSVIALDGLTEIELMQILNNRLSDYATTEEAKNIFNDDIKKELVELSGGVPYRLIHYSNNFLDYLIEKNLTSPKVDDWFAFTNKLNLISFSQIKKEIRQLTEKQKEILKIVMNAEEINATDLAKIQGTNRITAREHLYNLEKKMILETKSKDNSVCFYINHDFLSEIEKIIEEKENVSQDSK